VGVAAPVGLTFALMVDALAWAIVFSLLVIWRNTFGKALLYVANLLNFHVHIPHVWDHTFNLGKPFAEAEHGIRTWLEVEKTGLEIEIAWTWHALGEIWHKTARMLQWAVDETVGAFERLEHVKVPAWAKWAASAALPSALLAKIIAAVVAQIKPLLHKETTVIEQTFPTKVIQIERKSVAVALPGALGIPKIWREIHGLTKRNLRLSKRLHRVEGLFAASVMAAAMANALGLGLNWRCITRGNIGKTARRICGLPTHWLDDVLGLLADFFILENICTVLPWLETAASDIGTPLVEVLTEVGAGLCRGSAAPGALQGPKPSVPALIFGTATAGV